MHFFPLPHLHQLFERAHIVIATPRQWDALSRRWKKRRAITDTALFIADDLESIGDESAAQGGGATYEVVCSRMRLIAQDVAAASAAAAAEGDTAAAKRHLRIVALSMCVANARDLAEWLGAGPSSTFAFHPQVRGGLYRMPRSCGAHALSHPRTTAGPARARRAAAARL